MKTILVTGATDGIGLETARQLVAHGFRVLVHGRTLAKARRTAAGLAAEHAGADVEAFAADLTVMSEVAQLAHAVKAQHPTLDALVNNAGVFETARHLTSDGFERTMAVNHFAHFLLTHHLLPALKRARAARIVTVSSIAHQSGRIDLDDLAFARGFDGYDAYATSKLANVLFAFELARRLRGTNVTSNALHPGVISTKLLAKGFGMGGAPVAQGARTSVYLVTSDDVIGVSGRYFVDCREAAASKSARDERLAAALWAASEQALAKYL